MDLQETIGDGWFFSGSFQWSNSYPAYRKPIARLEDPCLGFGTQDVPRNGYMGMGQNYTTREPQVLVLVSFSRVPFWVPIFDPHPHVYLATITLVYTHNHTHALQARIESGNEAGVRRLIRLDAICSLPFSACTAAMREGNPFEVDPGVHFASSAATSWLYFLHSHRLLGCTSFTRTDILGQHCIHVNARQN